jgi:hypothetical protein
VTKNEEAVRARISKTLKMYGQLPSYKAMFEREGVSEPGDIALVGSESKVRDLLEELVVAGVTDFAASEFTTSKDEGEETRELIKVWNREHQREHKA